MALHWKLVVDCADPHLLADFWAEALGYVVEDPGTLVTQLLEGGMLPPSETREHRGSQRFRTLAAVRHPDDEFDEVSGAGSGRRILFQQVPEQKQGKNRLHIDVHAEDGDADALADRLAGAGAERVELVD